MSTTSYLSAIVYTDVAGSLALATDFTFPFPYLSIDHVFVFRDNIQVTEGTGFVFLDDYSIRLTTGIGIDEVVVIRRITKLETRMADYSNGSYLTEDDLNSVTKQLLYLIQEINDVRAAQDPNGNGDNSGGLPGSPSSDPDFIDQLIAELLGRQTFKDLLELVDLTDINSELIIAEQLENHKQWSLDRVRTDLHNKLQLDVLADGATVIDFIETYEEDQLVRINDYDFLFGKIGGNTSLIGTHRQLVVDLDSAYAARFTTVEATAGNAEAGVSGLQTSYAAQDLAIATLQNEVTARVRTDDLETLISESSYVGAIQTTANSASASILGLESYLVGVNGDINNPDDGSFFHSMSIYQNTVDGHADQLGTELQFRQTLASRFGGDEDDPTALAAAIENTWETFANDAISGSSIITTLQANSQPQFVNDTTPDPRISPWTDSNTAWATEGFPVGSMWYQQISLGGTTGRWRVRPFVWLPPSITVGDLGDEDLIEGTDYFPFRTVAGNTPMGAWFPAKDWDLYQELATDLNGIDQAMGARIDTIQEVLIGDNSSYAALTQRLQADYGQNITNIEQWMRAYVDIPDPNDPDDNGGLMYSGYGVRMNQYNGTSNPVIAGFALGIQADPNNPEEGSVSDFIVMADNFAVVAPPDLNDPDGILDGEVNLNEVRVPFIIDTETGLVGIDGDLTVKGTLRSYKGGLKDVAIGRASFQQLDANLDPILTLEDGTPDAEGEFNNAFRLNLNSSTENYWSSDGGSPFPGGSSPQKFLQWAGEGVMNHNNAIFYIDTDGNAYFGGQVSAENIDGDLSTGTALNVFISDLENTSDSNWVQVGGVQELSSNAIRGREPLALVNIALFGTANAQEAKLEMDYEVSEGVWNGFQEVNKAAIDTSSIGSQLTLSGGLGIKVYRKVRVRVSFRKLAGTGGSSLAATTNGYKGYIFALS